MSYTGIYKAERYAPLQKVLEQMSKLSPGGRMVIKSPDRQSLSRTRSLLYDWLSHNGLKFRYRIEQRLSFLELVVVDLRLPGELKISIEAPPTEKDALMVELIKDENPEELLSTWLKDGKISLNESANLLQRYKEIMQ